MGRPKKETVDFFSHDCEHGKTIFILEESYGNDGYAFWFKLLEILGKTNGHVFDCRNISNMKFLQAKTKQSEETTLKILNLLSDLEAIDPEMWKEKLIWSQNFVDRLREVYANRRVETPTKHDFYTKKTTRDVVSTPKSTHSRVEYSRVEESIVEENKKITALPISENGQLDWDFEKSQFLLNSVWSEKYMMNNPKLSEDQFNQQRLEFLKHIENGNDLKKCHKLQVHFSNWNKKNIEKIVSLSNPRIMTN